MPSRSQKESDSQQATQLPTESDPPFKSPEEISKQFLSLSTQELHEMNDLFGRIKLILTDVLQLFSEHESNNIFVQKLRMSLIDGLVDRYDILERNLMEASYKEAYYTAKEIYSFLSMSQGIQGKTLISSLELANTMKEKLESIRKSNL